MSQQSDKTVRVEHLGGITANYRLSSSSIDPSKPTVILVCGFMTNIDLFKPQFSNTELTNTANLVAIDVLGHGKTQGPENGEWTYWDTAIMNLAVMEKLGVKEAYVLGTAQGGWIAARMALLGGKKIKGIVVMGTSMDAESDRSRANGCWTAEPILAPAIAYCAQPHTEAEFVIPESLVQGVLGLGFGPSYPAESLGVWKETITKTYTGEQGRKMALMATISLKDRDSLLARIHKIKCPVLWLQGTGDPAFSVPNAQEEIKLFTGSSDASVQVVEGGWHYMSAVSPDVVDPALLGFLKKHP